MGILRPDISSTDHFGNGTESAIRRQEASCLASRCAVDAVQHLTREPDGDVHIELRLSRAYRYLLTAANAYQRCPGHRGPHLVVEIIPQNGELPFPDNSATRAGFVTPKAPKAGQRVKVTGPYVWDTNALHDLIYPGRHIANWAEVHPAWNVTVIRRPRQLTRQQPDRKAPV